MPGNLNAGESRVVRLDASPFSKFRPGETLKRPSSRVLGWALALVALVGASIAYRISTSNPNPDSVRRMREAVLKQDLQTMRQAIDNYTMDKQEAPHSLQDLVDAHYVHEIPIDPACEKLDWNPHFGETILPNNRMVSGVDNVFSGCSKSGSNGILYSSW